MLLIRRGYRAEAFAITGVLGAMLLYNASLNINPGWVFGGDSPGPRYFYLAMPFAILPLGLVITRAPALVAAVVGSRSSAWPGHLDPSARRPREPAVDPRFRHGEFARSPTSASVTAGWR